MAEVKSSVRLSEVREVRVAVSDLAALEEFIDECRDAEERAGGVTGILHLVAHSGDDVMFGQKPRFELLYKIQKG
jgi:hypothetical protein